MARKKNRAGRSKSRSTVPGAADKERQLVVDTVHDLLNGPHGEDLLDESFEKERVVLDIPKAWVVLAAWLAIKERKRRAGKSGEPALMRPDDPAHVDKNVRTWARPYLWRLIHDQMHMELHTVSLGTHPFLSPEKKERMKKSGRELDDGVPF